MKRRVLPLNALRAFEVAARHESFKQAADELGVSDAAVSRQVRDLESLLGLRLFDRDHRRVRLTDVARTLSARVTSSFDEIDGILSSLTNTPSVQIVSVSVEPTFAALFLMPRLAEFAESWSEIEVRLDSSSAVADVSKGNPRLAIRHSVKQSTWPKSQSEKLLDSFLTPLISPGGEQQHLDHPADILDYRLLRDENEGAWRRWLALAGITVAPRWGPVFSDAALALQGAELGQGAALGNLALAADRLAAGAIHAPFDLHVSNGAYWLVAADFRDLTKSELIFCEWLRRAVKQATTAATTPTFIPRDRRSAD